MSRSAWMHAPRHSATVLVVGAAAALVALGAAAAPPDRSAPPPVGALPRFDVTAPRELKLKNGLRVWFVERRRAPLADVVAVVDASIAADPPALPGLAAFTAGMLTQGAGELDAIAYANACDALGAEVGSFVDDDGAGLALHVEASRLGPALDLFAAALTRPRFTSDDWRRVQTQTGGEMLVQAQEPQALARLAALRAAWGPDHRFGLSPDGTPRALLATTAEDLRAFHAARYRPDTTLLVVVGDIDERSLVRHLERALGSWTRPGAPPPRPVLVPPVVRSGQQLVTVHVPEAAQTALRVVHAAPADVLPWTADIDVMNTMLGGSFTSRLNTNLREEHGYSYGARSGIDFRRAGNVFQVVTSVATPATVPAIGEILSELEGMAELARDDEVARARGVAALALPAEFDNGRNIAMLWTTLAARGLDPARLTGFMTQAAAVGPGAVLAGAQRVLAPKDATIVAVGDMDVLGDDLARLAPRVVLTPADLLPGIDALAQRAMDGAAR